MKVVNCLDEKFMRDGRIKPTDKLLKKLDDYTNADVLIMGHKHPKETFDYLHNGKRFIICKRGLTELEV